MTTRTLLVAFSFTVSVFGACVDTTPIDFHDNKDGGPDLDSGAIAKCGSCVFDPGAPCRSAYDACAAVDKCADIIQCAMPLGCFLFPNLEDRLSCAQPCFAKYQVTGTSPLVTPLILLNSCTSDHCKAECNGTP